MKSHTSTFRLDLLITLLGLIGAGVFFGLYDQAFPAAALDLELSRQEIAARAEAEAAALGFNVDGYISTLSFSGDWSGSNYLQRSLGVAEANRLIREQELPVWYWHMRWFRPLQKEEYSLYLAPNGRVVAFFHTIEEAAPGAAVTEDEARRIAEAYLTGSQNQTMDAWTPVSASNVDRPGGRRDHFFEWKRADFDVKGAELRTSVTVQGDRAGHYNYWIKVPEEALRTGAEQSNRASFLDGLSSLFGIGGFGIAALVLVGVYLFRYGRMRTRALWVAAGVGVVMLLVTLNSLPLYTASYDTTLDYTQFWFEALFYGAIGLAGMVGYLAVLWLGGERAARLAWPRQDKVLALEGDRWINLARSAWRGLMAAGILGGYVVIFYLVAVRLFGSWAPLDVNYSDAYATPFPFLYPIAGGLQPAVEEETLFRLVGVSLMVWLIGRRSWFGRFLALLIPGALWAFAHVTYVRDPYYLRGIEILIPAVLLYGLLFLRFDLTTTIVMHMTYNAMLGALPMLRSGQAYFVFSGMVVVIFLLLPLVPGVVRLLRRRGGMPEAQIAAAEPADLPALAKLPAPAGALPDADDTDDARAEVWARLLEDPERSIRVLRLGEAVTGYAVGRVAAGEAGGEGRIESVYVDRGLRGRYYGSRLVDALRQDLAAKGATEVRATLDADDHAGRAFLAGLGWSPQAYTFAPGSLLTPGDYLRLLLRRGKKADPEEHPGFQTKTIDL